MRDKKKARILIADDEVNIREGLSKLLRSSDYDCLEASGGEIAYKILMTESVDLIISDIKMPGMDGLELLEKVSKLHIPVPIIFITGHASIEMAVDSLQKGAYDFLIKPVDMKKLELLIEKAISERGSFERPSSLQGKKVEKPQIELIGESKVVKNLTEKIKHIAKSRSNIYILGESGTGKEVVCDMLHYYDDPQKPLVKVNCAALSSTLLESELFGHEKGSFTGASGQKIGRFEAASGGSIFLDEISEVGLDIQVKLLRVVQEKKIERVGSAKSIKVDIRIICASNKDLSEEVKNGRFREDLFYRLNVIDLYVPPLRDRMEDLPLLARYFFEKFALENNKKIEIDTKVYERFQNYDWPGNIRELQNAIEKIVVLSRTPLITEEFLPKQISAFEKKEDFIRIPYGVSMSEAEKTIILKNLAHLGNNKSKLARILGLGRKTVQLKLKSYGVEEDENKKN